MRTRTRGEQGASAVEFALVVPVLFLFVFGIIEYGNFFKLENQADSAAMIGARTLALNGTPAAAQAAAQAAAGSKFTTSDFATTPCTTAVGANATVTVNKTYTKLFGIVPTPSTIKGKGVVRCEN